MRISNKKLDYPTPTFTLSNSHLKESCQVKDLGVVFCSNLSFSNQITTVINKAKQKLFLQKKFYYQRQEHLG